MVISTLSDSAYVLSIACSQDLGAGPGQILKLMWEGDAPLQPSASPGFESSRSLSLRGGMTTMLLE